MQTYYPSKVDVTFGVLSLGGFAKGAMVSISNKGAGVKSYVGAAGEAGFVENSDESSEVVVRIVQTSPTGLALWALFQAGNLPLPLVVKSGSTGRMHVAAAAKLKLQPDVSYEDEMPVDEWTFICPKMNHVVLPV